MAPHNSDTPPVDDELLFRVADARVRGRSWTEAAAEVEWDTLTLRLALNNDPRFDTAMERAQREVDDEAQAEGLHRLRTLLRDDNPDIAMRAAEVITKYVTEKRRDETRLAVETLRAEGRAARAADRAKKAAEKKAEQAGQAAEQDDEPRPSPEEEREWREREHATQKRIAATVEKAGLVVYLWGGGHRIFDTPPDTRDVPLQLMECQDALVGGNTVYYALPIPYPTDPVMGPFRKD